MNSRSNLFRSLPILVCLASPAAFAQGVPLREATPHVTVTGTAQTEVVPDLAILTFAVQTEKPTPQQASAENAAAAQAVIAELKAEAIEAKNIRTLVATLQPVYDEGRDFSGRLIKKVPRGYQARNEIEVRLHISDKAAADKAGALAQKLVAKGANIFSGMRFEVEKPEARIKGLQELAMRDALANAQSYANPLGLKLKRVIEIAPVSFEQPMRVAAAPMRRKMEADPETAPAIPLEPGTETLSARVSVTWELGD